jgi:hypothetical protein
MSRGARAGVLLLTLGLASGCDFLNGNVAKSVWRRADDLLAFAPSPLQARLALAGTTGRFCPRRPAAARAAPYAATRMAADDIVFMPSFRPSATTTKSREQVDPEDHSSAGAEADGISEAPDHLISETERMLDWLFVKEALVSSAWPDPFCRCWAAGNACRGRGAVWPDL